MQMFRPTFHSFLMLCINGSCMLFVIWKTIECIQHYVEIPIGTKLRMKRSADLPFPDITVCGKFRLESKTWFGVVTNYTDYFNHTYLNEICDMLVHT